MASELEVGKIKATPTTTTGGVVIDASGQTDTTARLELKADRPSADQDACDIRFYNNNAAPIAHISAVKGSGANDTDGKLDFYTTNAKRLTIASTGDISLFDDTGTAATLRWDAADERLNLTGSDYQLSIKQPSAPEGWYFRALSDGSFRTHLNGTGDIQVFSNTGLATFTQGIAFSQTNSSATGATATGTTLDHYEEGTWTCTLGGVTGGNTTAYYTRVGDIVTVWFYSGSIASDGSAASISGLPFAVSGAAYGGFFCYHNTYVPTANSGYFSVNNTSGYFTAANATASASSANGTGRYLMFTGVYKVA